MSAPTEENAPGSGELPGATLIARLTWQEARDLQVHPVADWFPMMSGKPLKDFKTDIDEQSQDLPALIWKNKDGKLEILDGRHRRDVCVELKRDLRVQQFEGTEEEARNEIISRNLHRRHLKAKERAAIATKLAAVIAGEGSLSPNDDKLSKRGRKEGRPSKGITAATEEAADVMNVSVRSVQRDRRKAGESFPRKEKPKAKSKAAKKRATQPFSQQVWAWFVKVLNSGRWELKERDQVMTELAKLLLDRPEIASAVLGKKGDAA
jgi:ParB-like chromosome segregation protein Spo0J